MNTIINLATLLCYLLSSILYIIMNSKSKKKLFGKLATYTAIIGWLLHTVVLVFRTIEAKHPPFANIYEALIFFSWAIVLCYLVFEYRYKLKTPGAFVLPIALLTLASARLLPSGYKVAKPLLPALQSNWLIFHVVSAFLAYACFTISFATAIIYLIRNREIFDEISYKAAGIGFLLLTLGIVTGAFWGHIAWGRYWGWDPKETWSLITWLIYAAYLHARFTAGFSRRKAAYVSIAGFLAMLFTFIGVTWLMPGLHAYK